MHFYRFDPDPAAKEPAKVIDIFQLAMPTAGFVSMVYFFQHRLRAMIARGEVTQQMLAAAEALWPSDGNERS